MHDGVCRFGEGARGDVPARSREGNNVVSLRAQTIDDRPTNKMEDLEGANNFVRAALDDLEAGRPVRTAYAQPYGCSIKYPDAA